MNFLLPHRFKTAGAVIMPLGFALWLAMQLGYVTKMLIFIFGKPSTLFHAINVVIAIISFFSFLLGIYFLTFSKEKIEDEMVQRTRLDSFQFAALIQILLILTGFLFMLLVREPGKEGMLFFFVILVSLFWLSFIFRFNYMLHVKFKP